MSSTRLATAYLEGAGTTAERIDPTVLEETLGRLYERARASWPGVSLADEKWARHVAERAGTDLEIERQLDRISDDLYLACACLSGDPTALEVFDRVVLGTVVDAVRRFDASPAFGDEIRHLTRVRLLVSEPGRPPRLAGYQGKGSLRGWVQVTAVRIVLEQKRSAHAEQPADDGAILDAADLSADPELACVRHMYKDDFGVAFKDALQDLSSRERNALRMSHLDGLSIDEIGAVYRVHRSTAARWIARAHEMLLFGTRRRLVERLRISEAEFESLMLVVQSHLDLSLGRFLEKSKG